MSSESKNKILSFIREEKIIRPKDLARIEVQRHHLYQLVSEGKVEKIGRGLYTLPDTEFSEYHEFAEVSKSGPKSVICLLSALQFYNLTTQMPFEIWVAIGHKERKPKIDTAPVRIVRMSGDAFEKGVKTYEIDKIPVQIFSMEKTIADCFKFRNKIGKEVAIEALNEFITDDRGSIDELWYYAKICRVRKTMQPYLEAYSV